MAGEGDETRVVLEDRDQAVGPVPTEINNKKTMLESEWTWPSAWQAAAEASAGPHRAVVPTAATRHTAPQDESCGPSKRDPETK